VARATSRGKQKLILKIMEKMTGLMENLKLTEERTGVQVTGFQSSRMEGREPQAISKVLTKKPVRVGIQKTIITNT
jgi:hypothetical protein